MEYCGTKTKVIDLPAGTKFRVHNGAWNGEIVMVDGEKKLLVEGDAPKNAKHIGAHSELYITIKTP